MKWEDTMPNDMKGKPIKGLEYMSTLILKAQKKASVPGASFLKITCCPNENGTQTLKIVDESGVVSKRIIPKNSLNIWRGKVSQLL